MPIFKITIIFSYYDRRVVKTNEKIEKKEIRLGVVKVVLVAIIGIVTADEILLTFLINANELMTRLKKKKRTLML